LQKYGFTQGSPLSPLLCAYALELGGMGKIDGLTMFADDGIIVSEEEINIKDKLNKYSLKISGARLAEDKPHGLSSKFKFLGLEYDLEKRQVVLFEDRVETGESDEKGKTK